MKYSIISLFPDFFTSPLNNSLMFKAIKKGLVSFAFHNPRDFTENKHKNVDDTPYGGGAGMLMSLQPLVSCLENVLKEINKENNTKKVRIIALSPDGEKFTQEKAQELSREEEIILICGRYEGFDARLFELFPIEKISLGDFVLNGGEIAALTLVEASARLLPNFMSKESSFIEESFNEAGLLEHNHYTKPPVFQGKSVPEVLLSGNHAEIEKFRQKSALEKTFYTRPDLIQEKLFNPEETKFIKNLPHTKVGKNLSIALLHFPVIIKEKNRKKEIGTSSVTNLDIHDIARSSRTYNVHSFYIVTPLEDQAKLVRTLTNYWTDGQGARANSDRQNALSLAKHVYSWQEASEEIEQESGQKPFIIGTSAQIPLDKKGKALVKQISWKDLKKLIKSQKILLLFGTSHGIDEVLLKECDAILPPLRGFADYNHLSVRAAVALYLDRIIGEMT